MCDFTKGFEYVNTEFSLKVVLTSKLMLIKLRTLQETITSASIRYVIDKQMLKLTRLILFEFF